MAAQRKQTVLKAVTDQQFDLCCSSNPTPVFMNYAVCSFCIVVHSEVIPCSRCVARIFFHFLQIDEGADSSWSGLHADKMLLFVHSDSENSFLRLFCLSVHDVAFYQTRADLCNHKSSNSRSEAGWMYRRKDRSEVASLLRRRSLIKSEDSLQQAACYLNIKFLKRWILQMKNVNTYFISAVSFKACCCDGAAWTALEAFLT